MAIGRRRRREDARMAGVVAILLLVAGGLSACSTTNGGPGGCVPDPLPSPATTTLEGTGVFVVQSLERVPGACPRYVQVGAIPYVYPDEGSDRTFRTSELEGPAYAVGGPGTEEITEVRKVRGVPIEYALAAHISGDGWVGLGGRPVEEGEMETEAGLAETICAALKDRSSGWSFCR